MWHTQRGDRVLRGTEAKVFAESLLELVESEPLEEADGLTGISVFDSLSYPQKIAVLGQVANALFREDVPMPELTAVLEGAVGAVIQNLHGLVEEEIQISPKGDTSFRSLVSKACQELGIKGVPRKSCDDVDKWEFCVNCLHDAILWDYDYCEEDLFADLPPEHGHAVKEHLGVSDGYFLAVAPDPTPKQTDGLRADLKSLCHEVAERGRPRTTDVRKSPKPKN